MPITANNPFKGRQHPGELIVLCVRWYLRYPLSYEHVAEMMAERGVGVDTSCIWRWVQAYAPELTGTDPAPRLPASEVKRAPYAGRSAAIARHRSPRFQAGYCARAEAAACITVPRENPNAPGCSELCVDDDRSSDGRPERRLVGFR
jgi:hypothetical protein